MSVIPTPFSCPFALGRSRPRASSSSFLWAPPPTTSAQFFAHFSRPTYAFPIFLPCASERLKSGSSPPYKKKKKTILLFRALVWQWNIHFSRPLLPPPFWWYEAISWLVLCRVFNLFPGHDLFPYIRGENNNNENKDLAVSLAIGKRRRASKRKLKTYSTAAPVCQANIGSPEITQFPKLKRPN